MFPAVGLVLAGLFFAPRATVELVADKLSIKPGESFTVALHMRMPAGWHAYYVNPGEIGAPPRLQWTLPDGVGVGQLLWPTPDRILVAGVLANTYSNDVWLPVKIATSRELPVGRRLTLTAKATWFLCRDKCVPDSADLSLSVAVKSRSETDPFHEPLVTAALAAVPPPYDGPGASARLVGNVVRLSLPGMKVGQVPRFFGADPAFFGTEDALQTVYGGIVTLSIPLSKHANGKPKRLTGIVAPANGRPFYIDIPIGRS